MSLKKVKATFESKAPVYDGFIEKVIPHYHSQHQLALKLIRFAAKKKLRLCDLGIGTGNFSSLVLKKYPNACLYGIDLSPRMLKVCRNKLKWHKGPMELEVGNIADFDGGGHFDVVFAGLSIHHLKDEGKKKLFKKICNNLNPHGVFILMDLVKGATPRFRQLYHRCWEEYEKERGINPDKISRNSHDQDIPANLEDQLLWLRQAGFGEVDCLWKYCGFALLGAVKNRA